MKSARVVIVHRPGIDYHREAPFGAPNPVYEAVEALFRGLGIASDDAGDADRGLMSRLIRPGDRVVVKPNFVSSRDRHKRIAGEQLEASSTHASLLRPIVEHALRATGPGGRVSIVDAPVEGCELGEVTGPLGVDTMVAELRRAHPNLELLDLRTFRVVPRFALDDARAGGRSFNLGVLLRRPLAGDPRGYRVVNLGERSFFADAGIEARKLCFHRSNRAAPRPHHRHGVHEYSIPRTVLDADVVVNVPKMKTHKKTGVTLSLKSAIGLTNEKYWLPHFTAGDPLQGGDEYDRPQGVGERVESLLSRLPLPGGHSLVARVVRPDDDTAVIDGSWHGNDTLWRTILDLNRILFFADRNGRLCETPQRRYLTVVDGIVAGEGEGPMSAEPLRAGLLVGGFDPVMVDYRTCELMGFDPWRIPQVARAIEAHLLPSTDLDSAPVAVDGPPPQLAFRAPRSWSCLH